MGLLDIVKYILSICGVTWFELNKKEFMVTVDNYSNFWEVDRLTSTTSAVISLKLKTIFHGVVALTT